MKKLFISISAVPLSIARPYLKNFKRHYPEIFNRFGSGVKKDRIYFDLDKDKVAKPAKPPKEVSDYLANIGYEIENYSLGIARDAKGKTKKIGKIIQDKDVAKIFANDPIRSASKSAVGAIAVISRHPYDIIGMSFDRGWDSCMNVKRGTYRSFLKNDIKSGTLVMYLVRPDDKNINNPISRLLLKPYKNDNGDVILKPSRTYGAGLLKFEEAAAEFCNQVNKDKPDGFYRLSEEVYEDYEQTSVYHGNPTDDLILSDDFEIEEYAMSVSDQNHVEIINKNFAFAVRNNICKNKNISLDDMKKFARHFSELNLLHCVKFRNLKVSEAIFVSTGMKDEERPNALTEILGHFWNHPDVYKIVEILFFDYQYYNTLPEIAAGRLLQKAVSENNNEVIDAVILIYKEGRLNTDVLDAESKKLLQKFV